MDTCAPIAYACARVVTVAGVCKFCGLFLTRWDQSFLAGPVSFTRAACYLYVCAMYSQQTRPDTGDATLGDAVSERYEPPHLREVVENATYFPGWAFYLVWSPGEGGSAETLKLRIQSWSPDSFDFSQWIAVNHFFLVPPASYNKYNWMAWLFDRIRDVLNHEAGEAFRVDGIRVFAPHHSDGEDPYRTWMMSDWETANKSSGDK